ncbi:Coiled-coil domain-containing protein 146 [Collichthys lucidus]|uniref:Coiled-coil domain-containing protein 146 n=1 Tax=Collichthys lucidus TaxID=240159 RepID=A0A4U5UPV2_COLLU|nr:Coiled-coil domain-containing protein 146 [Collichthys lucidus]
MSKSVLSQRQQSLCVTSTRSILHDRVITRAEEAKREALFLKTERLCSAERRRTNAVLKRMGLPIQQEPLPQPPAGPRPRPKPRVQERKIHPVSRVTVLPPIIPVTKKPAPPTNRGICHGTSMLHPQPPAGPRRPQTGVPGRKIISVSDVASQLKLPFTEVITKPALPTTHETHHETSLQLVQPVTIDEDTNYAAVEDLKCPEHIEREWLRMLRAKERRSRDREERQRLAEENTWAQLSDGRYTLGQTRPEAYIPQNDVLPVPKPYGAFTPFKPSELRHLRHFRRPTLRTIVI